MSAQRSFQLPPPVPARRDPKAVGARNRGRNLVGRTDPDDVPIAKQESPTPAEEITKANAWREVYKEEISQPSHFTLRTDQVRRAEKGSEQYDLHQFKTDFDIALLSGFGVEHVPEGKGSGISVGELTDAPQRTLRRPTNKTWWAFRDDKVRELIMSIAASSDWPAGSDKRVGFIVLYYFRKSYEDREVHERIPKVFKSANAVKCFIKGLNKYALELFGPDPDAKPESLKHWAQKLPDIRPNRGAYFECDEQDPNTKLQWSNVAVHSSTLGVGLGKRRGRNK